MTSAPGMAPVFLLLLVFSTYVLGSRYGTRIGVASALLVASTVATTIRFSPAWAMAAAVCWVASMAAVTGTPRRHALAGGLLGSVAIVARPELAPLGLVVVVFLLLRPERRWAQRGRSALEYAIPCAVGLAAADLYPLTHQLAAGSGGIGAVSRGILDIVPVVVLVVVIPLLLPGAITILLVTAVAVDTGLKLLAAGTGDLSSLVFVSPAIPLSLILLIAGVDAAWRRVRLPRPTMAVAVVTAALIMLEHV